ncbi:uncharacterized protein TNCV_3817651 [Trichonephila clavipes]|nr:uncharacterized protein TNCV_3817651 [Trichonephila clavipes]
MRISHKRLTIWKTTFAVLLPIYGHNCWKKSSKIGRPDWTTSEPAVAVICQKSYSKYLHLVQCLWRLLYLQLEGISHHRTTVHKIGVQKKRTWDRFGHPFEPLEGEETTKISPTSEIKLEDLDLLQLEEATPSTTRYRDYHCGGPLRLPGGRKDALLQFPLAWHHSKRKRRSIDVKGSTRNGRRDPKCPSAKRLGMVREDTGAPSQGTTCDWMAADEADGCTRLMMWRSSRRLIFRGRPEPGLRVNDILRIHWSQNLLTTQSEWPIIISL